VRIVGVAVGAGIALLLVHILYNLPNQDIVTAIPNNGEVTGRAPVKDSPEYLLKQYDSVCWTEHEQPLAQLPGAAIVQYTNGHTVYTRDHDLVDAAFSESLHGLGFNKEPVSDRIDPIALCR